MKRIFAAAATATLLATGGAFAQATPTEQPAEGYVPGSAEQLRSSVEAEFAQHGIDYPVGALTLDQLAEIELVLTDESTEDDQRLAQIEQIIQQPN